MMVFVAILLAAPLWIIASKLDLISTILSNRLCKDDEDDETEGGE